MCSTVLEHVWGERALHPPLTTERELHTLMGGAVGTADTLHLVVDALVAEGRACTVIHNSTTYIKFVLPGDTVPPAITQGELGEYSSCRMSVGAVRALDVAS